MLRHTRRIERRGAILIVVLAMLSLFAIVGITFVLVASASAEKQRILRDAAGIDNGPAIIDNGEDAFRRFLAQLIYDVPDDATGLQSSLRGHSLAATMYGRYYALTPAPIQRGSNVAWNGVGTFNSAATATHPERRLVQNYRFFSTATAIYDPEITAERPPTALPGSTLGSAYVPKNAPYTYPDCNNLFLATICPATGEVLVPSFHRQAAFGSLDPSNPNWTNAQGKYLILRPRPQEHPQFPRVGMNADGSHTGDVQNMTGAYSYDPGTGRFIAKNDSSWIDIGAPIVTGRDGRRYKMLVAPLILDLDGRINLSVHGNRMKQINSPPTGSRDDFVHTSGAGIGPHEIGLERAFGLNSQEGRELVFRRGLAQARSTQSQQKFAARYAATQHLPSCSQVPWTGFNTPAAGSSLTIPSYANTTQFWTSPSYSPACYDETNMLVANHPVLFSPAEWLALPGTTPPTLPRTYSLADTKLLSLRHAFAPSFYAGMEVGSFAPNALGGGTKVVGTVTIGLPNPNPPGQTTPNNYRLDPAHAFRHLVATLSADLDRPGMTPTIGASTSFNVLGGVDLNRTLTDYRVNTGQALLPNNIIPPINAGTSLTQADIDRQNLARDIFARLIVASNPNGASVDNAGNITIADLVPGTNDADYNVVRGLAQLAVNIVDYTDADDVITSFVWKPENPADPYSPTNYAAVGIRVVFGTEKPRLTINEAYIEAVNDPSEPGLTMMAGPTNSPHVRVWAEFQNATRKPYPTGSPGSGPLGDGAARLQYDLSEQSTTLPPVINPYRIEVIRNGKGGWNSAVLRDPALSATNVKGEILGGTPDLVYGFNQAGPTTRLVAPADGMEPNPAPPNFSKVVIAPEVPDTPAGPQFDPAVSGWNVINAAAFAPGAATLEFVSDVGLAASVLGDILAPAYNHYTVVLRRLANPHLAESPSNPYITIDILDHVKAADRIIRSNRSGTDRDAKTAANGQGYDPNTPNGGDVSLLPQSTGKVQPYTAYSQATTGILMPFPLSLVQRQNPDSSLVGSAGEGVRHTFNRQNSIQLAPPPGPTPTYTPAVAGTSDATLSDTLMTPYDWLVHLDRPVINPIELLHVSAGKPHELTLNFMVPNTAPVGGGKDVVKSAGSAQWLPVPATAFHPFGQGTSHPYSLYPNLYRALDLLRIQPYGHQTALGGRIHGKINLNTIQDKRIWDALFDQQNGNGFTQPQIDAMWTALIQTRTRNMVQRHDAAGSGLNHLTPVPGTTIYDANANDLAGVPYDRPFLQPGAATIAGPAGSTLAPGVTAFQGGIGLDDTFLRRDPATGEPMLMIPQANPPLHPYQRIEAARKIMNNTTTVSNVFAVWVTVGYFEVTTPVGTAPEAEQWGKEYYFEVPGDMRQKMFAIVDRTQMGTPANFYEAFRALPATTPLQQSGGLQRPFFTTVEPLRPTDPPSNTLNIAAAAGDNAAGTAVIYSDGVPVTIDPANNINNRLVVGTGANQEFVQVTGVSFTVATPTTPAFATLTTSPLTKSHAPGELVSNMMPCNPGPQNVVLPLNSQSQFAPVIPHWSRAP